MIGGQEVKWSISENMAEGWISELERSTAQAGGRKAGQELGRRGGAGQGGDVGRLGVPLSPFHPYDPSDHEFHRHPGIRRQTETDQGRRLEWKDRVPETPAGSPDHSPLSPTLVVRYLDTSRSWVS